MGISFPYPSPKSLSLYDAGGCNKIGTGEPCLIPQLRCEEDRGERNLWIGDIEGRTSSKDEMARKHCRRGVDKEGDS
jgi:hypothetical protein